MTQARQELTQMAPGRPTAVTLGKFDGVHRGHQHLIARLVQRAQEEGLASVVVVLHPHPAVVLQPGTPITYLCTLEERLRRLQALGPERVGVLTFTHDVASLSAREFVALLRQTLDMRLMVMGPDTALGKAREGDVQTLASLGREMGFQVEVVPILEEGGQKVGSSAVRQALARGDMERVAHLLGRPYVLQGPVVRGDGRGRELGFPTANIAVPADLALPPYGIYVTRAYVGEVGLPACTSIGIRPTFAGREMVVETYILDFDGDLYGKELRIELLHRLRDEEKFPTVEALVEAMHRDILQAREYFARHG
jgi:riboflavin kinase/FMN adenylyltransferase